MKVKDIITEAPKKKDKYAPVDLVNANDPLKALLISHGTKITAFIKKHCKPWLKQTKNGTLMVYRGYSNIPDSKIAFTKVVRSDRSPLDSDKKDHEFFNTVIRICGKTANRSNSLFVSGDDDQAEQYGSVYITLPVGEFNYTWSPETEDWSGWDNDMREILADNVPTVTIDDDTKKTLIAQFRKQYQAKMAKAAKKAPKAKANNPIDKLYELIVQYGYKGTYSQLQHALDYFSYSLGSADRIRSYQSDMSYDLKQPYPSRVRGYIFKAHRAAKGQAQKNVARLIVTASRLAASVANKTSKQGLNKSDFSVMTEKEYVRREIAEYIEKLARKEKAAVKGIHPEVVKKYIGPMILGDDNTLHTAIRKGHEIMIHCEKGLAIKPEVYEFVVLPMLRGKKPDFKSMSPSQILSSADEDDDMW